MSKPSQNLKKLKKKFSKFHNNFILASSSPRRADILKNLELEFETVNSNVNENKIIKKIIQKYKKNKFIKLVEVLSLAKVLNVLKKKKYKSGLVIGFDTIVVLKDEVLGKPKNKLDAIEKLYKLSGKKHYVLTGVCIINIEEIDKKIILNDIFKIYDSKMFLCGYEKSIVEFKKLTSKEINQYASTKEPYDKAGAYAIQGQGKKFIKSIYGDYFNIVGLPVDKFYLMLEALRDKKNTKSL